MTPLPTARVEPPKRAPPSAEDRGYRIACGHELEFFLRPARRGGELRPLRAVPGLVYRMDPRVDPAGA